MQPEDNTEEPSSNNANVEKRSKLFTVAPYILGNEFGERLAYYGLSTNFVNYFKDLGASSATATIITMLFSGFCYLFPLLGGWVADAKWGRYRTILIFSLIYISGMVMLSLSAAIPGIRVEKKADANPWQWILLAASLGLVAMGTGGIKPNVSTFGADQFDESDEKENKEKKSFFNWFYFFINVGSLISLGITDIQDRNMWDVGFAIPAAALVVAVIFFVAGKPKYKISPATESPLELFISVSRTALRNRSKHQKKGGWKESEAGSSDAPLIRDPATKQHWLDWAVTADGYTQQQVDDVKLVYGIFPIFWTTCFYWVVYSQITTAFILQGQQMERVVSFRDRPIPSAMMTIADTGSIILLIPIYDLVIVPFLKKRYNIEISILQRIGAGYFFAVISMLSAFVIEHQRIRIFRRDGAYAIEEDGDDLNIVRISIWWMLIPYGLVGTSEVLASIGTLEFFYSQAPDSMRSMMASLSLVATAVGNYIGTLIVAIVNPLSDHFGRKWITNDLNEGHLEYYYLLIAALMLWVLFVFYFVAHSYKYKNVHHRVSAVDDGERRHED